jgi:hypothetical protein
MKTVLAMLSIAPYHCRAEQCWTCPLFRPGKRGDNAYLTKGIRPKPLTMPSDSWMISIVKGGGTKTMLNDFTILLGMRLDEVVKTETVQPLMVGSKTDLIDDRFHLQIASHGIEFVADFDGRVSTIFFYSGERDDYRHFSGMLPEGVSFQDSQSSIHHRLGQPNASGGGKVIQFLGKVPKWDRYDRHGFSLHIQFVADEASIGLVALMRPDSIPEDQER